MVDTVGRPTIRDVVGRASCPVAAQMKRNPSLYEGSHDVQRRATTGPHAPAWVEFDIAFHRGLIAASGLSPLLAFCDVLAVFSRVLREREESQGVAGVASLRDRRRHPGWPRAGRPC